MGFLQIYFLILTFRYTHLLNSTVFESINGTSFVHHKNTTMAMTINTTKVSSRPTNNAITPITIFPRVIYNSTESQENKTDYRRFISDLFPMYNKFKNHESSTFLCLSLVTPYLTGQYKNINKPEVFLPTSSYVFLRVMQLLTIDQEQERDKDEISAVLYQISRLKIKLYLWSYEAMTLLLEKIIGYGFANKISFKDLKAGLKRIINNWQLDITNATLLLIESRMFRPPCLNDKPQEGSTKRPFAATPREYILETEKDCDEMIYDNEETTTKGHGKNHKGKGKGKGKIHGACADFQCVGKECENALSTIPTPTTTTTDSQNY